MDGSTRPDDVARRRDAAIMAQHLRWAFVQAPVPIAILHEPGHIVELTNQAMADAWERVPGEALGRPLFEVLPEARARFEALLDGVIATGQPYIGKETVFRVERAPDGSLVEHHANFIYAPIRNGAGAIECVLVLAVDISDEIRARDEMQRLRAEAEAANQAKDQFLAMLGHELRNPLAPIATTLQVLRLRGVAGREREVLERQVGHLTRLVDDLLDISRATRGKITLHRRVVELAALVAEALEVSSPLLEHGRHRVEVDVPPTGLEVLVDLARMVQVVSNLLSNAAKYSDPGTLISIRGGRIDHRIRLSVRDRGAGIAPEMLDGVFDMFVQQEQTIERARGGLGLGLAIVRNLVELHDGTVSAASAGPGRGSEFTIELPATAGAAERAPPAEPSAATQAPPATKGRILVVDDNEDAAEMLAAVLEHLGYQIAVAHDGPAALRVAAGFAPDVALLDLGLPVMDGYELARRLRALRVPGAPLHLVAVTGYGQDSDRQRTARAGFEHHLVKPVDLEELSRILGGLTS